MSAFTIGKYKVFKKRIGRGAFSIVYKGIEIDTNKVYAIKEINLDSLSKNKENIKRETKLMRKLKHRNIITLHDVILDKAYHNIYLILDYYKKGDLMTYLGNKPLKEMYAKKYLRQIADGLKYLLDNNIMHRDIKPQNILITDTNDLVITDFGFARYIDTSNDIMIQTLCGTPMYMAPEIMKHKKYDIKSDLWSVGIILYQMLFGCTPFKAKNFIDLIGKIENSPIDIPEEFKISGLCQDLLKGLLRKNPKERINWDEFFNHEWFSIDEIMDAENKLLDISIHKESSLPKLNDFQLSRKQFSQFKHKSIIEPNTDKSIQDNKSNQNIKINTSDQSDKSDQSDNIFNMQFSEEIKHNKIIYEEDNDESDNELGELFNSLEQSLNRSLTKPIDINYPKDYERKSNEKKMFVSKGEYDVIIADDYYSMSDPTTTIKPVSNSFKDILSSSINFLKLSYNYISSNTKSF